MSRSPSSSTTAVASSSSPKQEGGVSSAVGNGGGPDIASLCNRYAIVASSAPAPGSRDATLASLRRSQLPLQSLDVLFMQRHCLAQARKPIGVFLRVGLFIRQRRGR